MGLVVFGGSSTPSDAAPEADHTGFAGALKPPGARAPGFRLRDQDGRVVTMDDYRGRDVIVTFMYSTCQDTCPLTASQIRAGIDALGHDVPVLIVSVDPRDDTPFHMKRFLVKEQLAGRADFVTGTRAQLAPIWKRYGVQPQLGKQFDHTAETVIVDGRGLQRVGYLSSLLTPEDLTHDLRALGA